MPYTCNVAGSPLPMGTANAFHINLSRNSLVVSSQNSHERYTLSVMHPCNILLLTCSVDELDKYAALWRAGHRSYCRGAGSQGAHA